MISVFLLMGIINMNIALHLERLQNPYFIWVFSWNLLDRSFSFTPSKASLEAPTTSQFPDGTNFHRLPPDVPTASQVQVHRDPNVSTLHSLALTPPDPPTSVCLQWLQGITMTESSLALLWQRDGRLSYAPLKRAACQIDTTPPWVPPPLPPTGSPRPDPGKHQDFTFITETHTATLPPDLCRQVSDRKKREKKTKQNDGVILHRCVCVGVCASVCSCACLEVSFKLKHERQVISINCRLSGGSGVAAPLRKDIGEQAGKKKKRKKIPEARCCIVELREEKWGLTKGEGGNWQRKVLSMSPSGTGLSRKLW